MWIRVGPNCSDGVKLVAEIWEREGRAALATVRCPSFVRVLFQKSYK
jgi:hypothetical protein